jgi:hypothetical protein
VRTKNRAGPVVGIDVSATRGLDVVLLDERGHVKCAKAGVSVDEVQRLLTHWNPEVVAIDSPPGPARAPGATSRACERLLRGHGVNIFFTPCDGEAFSGRFYEWIRVGAEVFSAAERAGYPRQENQITVRRRALEVFPHASDVFLRGSLPPSGATRRVQSKRAWRVETLKRADIDVGRLYVNRVGRPTLDLIDAALAALTARKALEGEFCVVGDSGEWLVLPVRTCSRLHRPMTD